MTLLLQEVVSLQPNPNLADKDITLSLAFPLRPGGMGDPASSYATVRIALRILETLKPPHPDLPILRQDGDDDLK